tara:strand:- start:284 stop:1402 length:1119 start_codon:yes stop_codon:yes gene_type:complete
VLLVIGYLYYKVKFQFWSRQPVFHFHNIWYWYDPPGIIQKDKPQMDKFYNSYIEFDSYDNYSTEKKELFREFIKDNFLPHKTEHYIPTDKSINSYLESHNDKAYLSLNYKNRLSPHKNIISCMTTRPLECYVNNDIFTLYYVDYLCVHSKERKKGIAPVTIYSHYVNHRIKHDNAVFFFKREGETTLIVPLMVYKTYFYDISRWDKEVKFDQPNINVYKVHSQNDNHYFHFIKKLRQSFDCVIHPSVSNVINLCTNNELFIFILMIGKEDKALYVFRDPHITYTGKSSIELVCSFNGNITKELFTLGFFNCINQINKVKPFDVLLIENTSHNDIILKTISIRYQSFEEALASYYFYNYGSLPILSNNVFCFN